MQLTEFRDLLLSADPQARHYTHVKDGKTPYTTWAEYLRMQGSADNRRNSGWRIQIDRYTKAEFDPVAERIETMLDRSDGITYEYRVDYDQDSGYIRHTFDCEAI